MEAFQRLVPKTINLDYLTTHEFNFEDAQAYDLVLNHTEPF